MGRTLRRVAVTGAGVVSALGCDLDTFWSRLCGGESGVGPIRRFDTREFKVGFGGEIGDFDPADHLDLSGETLNPKELRRMDRFVHFALAAAEQAVRQSGLDLAKGDAYRHGVLVGSGIGGLNEIEEQHSTLYGKGPSRVSPFMIPKLMVNAASGNLSVRYGLKGPNSAIATACASATNAIGDAFRIIQHGQADVMLTGGSEAAVTPMGLSGFARMKALSTRNDEPQKASRPFDTDRDGFVLSEGAGLVVLEDLEHAQARGAEILGEVVGYGMSADGTHMTAPDAEGRGAARSMRNALHDAELNPGDIDYINAHGTSTPLGDKAETLAVKTVFGTPDQVPAVSSTKGALGHMLGASGGVEFVIGLLAISRNVAPPTINLDNPDPACDLDYIANQAREFPISRVLSNSFGFGGHNASVVLQAPA